MQFETNESTHGTCVGVTSRVTCAAEVCHASDCIARTTPILLALFSLVTVLALR